MHHSIISSFAISGFIQLLLYFLIVAEFLKIKIFLIVLSFFVMSSFLILTQLYISKNTNNNDNDNDNLYTFDIYVILFFMIAIELICVFYAHGCTNQINGIMEFIAVGFLIFIGFFSYLAFFNFFEFLLKKTKIDECYWNTDLVGFLILIGFLPYFVFLLPMADPRIISVKICEIL